MGYRTLRACVEDLEKTGQLVRIDSPVDPHLEAAEIQRRVFQVGGPAVYFASVKGCRFPMLSNLFGTMNRVRYIFRDALRQLERLVHLAVDPSDVLLRPRLYLKTPWTAWCARPKVLRSGPVLASQMALEQMPQLVCWPKDGGAYLTLPQVYTEDPDSPGLARANLGMYRVQISGGRYERNKQAGIHYQLHRGIGVHHAAAIRKGQPLRVNVFLGGAPAMSVAAVMPLPEGMSELAFAGMLGRHRIPMIARPGELPLYAEADFCIRGVIEPELTAPEGPFGDHLGYYSLAHEFPVMRVEQVYHRPKPIWPFTVVGRPPQEDTMFGRLIHELTGPLLPKVIPGLHAVHAVDAAGVHPLLLAMGSERYVPYEHHRRPAELLTLANAILGHGQLSLAKYLLLLAKEDAPQLDINSVDEVLRHVLERVDWRYNMHFQTCTTIDTLDYTGDGLNQGSKAIVAVAGPAQRKLPVAIDAHLRIPRDLGFGEPRLCLPGILVLQGPPYRGDHSRDPRIKQFCAAYDFRDPINVYPLIVIADDSHFAARTLSNFLWVTFTRSNPATDVYGIDSFTAHKHWGCCGSLVIDARIKPHHAPPLCEDPEVTRRVDSLAAPGRPLHGIL